MSTIEAEWRWPLRGLSRGPLEKQVFEIKAPYRSDPPPFSYPGTTVDEELAEQAARIIPENHNLIGSHTRGDQGEGGFSQAQELEAKVISMVGSVLGASDRNAIDGFFCGGGTEANLQGMWIGRELLRRHPDPESRGIVVLTTPLRHYSIDKAASILDLGGVKRYPCPKCGQKHLEMPDGSGRGLNLVAMNERGEMDVDDLERIVRSRHEQGYRQFMIVPTAATTALGSIDPIERISELIAELRRALDLAFYLHVDASFGAFTIPFASDHSTGSEVRIGFDLPEVMSVAADADKMGHLPYPAGIFLCRRGLLDYVVRHVNYVKGHRDDTVPGSRSFLPAALGWLKYRALGTQGQKDFVLERIEQRDRLVELLEERFPDADGPVKVLPCSPCVNLLAIEIDAVDGAALSAALEDGVLAPYQLRYDFFPSDPSDCDSCPKTVYKICVMPHVDPYLDRFVDDLEKVVRRAGIAAVGHREIPLTSRPVVSAQPM